MRHLKTSLLCTALLSIIFSFSMLTIAEANTNYKVKKGDNLSRIAKKFKVPVDKIREANKLESDDLSVGRKLIIPSNKSSKTEKHKKQKIDKTAKTEKTENPETAEAADKETSQKKEAVAPKVEYEYHTVKKGDTPSRIAKKYGISVRELKNMNHLSGNKLKTDRRLIVGKSVVRQDNETASAADRKNKRVNVTQKIEEVKELSQSDELSKLSAKERLILFAKKMIDLPYKFGGNGIFGLDCSSFVQKVYSFVDQPLPRSAREQYKVGEEIEKGDLKTGDLIFFRTYASFPSHVGIYIGNNMFIHASSRAKKVQIDSLDTPYYVKRFIGAKRLLSESESNAVVNELKTQAQPEIKP
jgi:peptidoglycan endopeptidase LytE